jgi:hypothetical protein
MSWMLMGFANLMMLPLRVEYLANPTFGLAFDAATIAFLTSVMPNLARLLLSPLWGRLFDTMNFFALRITLNIGFALAIATFFTGDSFIGLLVGAIIFGISTSGGDVAWSLWVTKFAPADKVADYMAVHTFFTGVRGVIAPIVAFQLIGVSLTGLAWLSSSFIIVASLLLIPEMKKVTGAPKASPLVKEISE